MQMTRQRQVLLAELRQSQAHLTAAELYDRVRQILPKISVATVYRNLELMSAAGIIGKLEISGREKRFDYDATAHDHIVCVVCRRIDNLHLKEKAFDIAEWQSIQGYSLTGYHVEIVGICPACKEKLNEKEIG